MLELSMIGGRVFMKEKVSTVQYVCVILIVVGSILVVAGSYTT